MQQTLIHLGLHFNTKISFPLFSSQKLGIAIGFLLPSIMVKNNDDISQIGNDLQLMFYSVAGFTTILAVLICLCKKINLFYFIFCIYQCLLKAPSKKRGNQNNGF